MTLHEVHPTAAVTLWNKQISQPTRTFIDHGSAACLINESLVKKLNLPKCRNEATVRGIVGRMNLKYTVDVSVAYLSSASDLLPPAESFPVTCYVVKDVNVCANIPDYDNPDLQFMQNKYPWADPREFSQQPIQLLLSTSAVAKGRVAQTDVLHRDNINLVANLYKIGWVINGNMPGPRSAEPVIRAVTLLDKEEEEDKDEELKMTSLASGSCRRWGTTVVSIQIQQKHTICTPAAGKSLTDMWYLSPQRTQLLNWDSPDPQLSIV